MTQYEMEKVIKIIENNMTVLPDYMTNLPRIVLTNHGLKNVKDELQQMVEVIKLGFDEEENAHYVEINGGKIICTEEEYELWKGIIEE